MTNTRLSTTIHLLTELARRPDETLSSAFLSDKVHAHAVVVRRLVGVLKKAGIVSSTRGAHGGIKLSMEAEDISLGMIAETLDEHIGFVTHSISVSVASADLFSDAVLSTIETERRKVHTAAMSHLDGVTLADVLAAAILRQQLTELVANGLSDEDIRTKYQIKNGHLVLK